MSKIKFNFELSGRDKEEEKLKQQMAQLAGLQALSQGKNPMEAYRSVIDWKPISPTMEAPEVVDPSQQAFQAQRGMGQPSPTGLPQRQIDPITSAGLKTDPAIDALRQEMAVSPFKIQQEREKAEIRGESKKQEAVTKATGNFGRVASAMKQYANYYSGALKEGGAGNLYKREKGKVITQVIGGGAGEKLTDTGKLFGQRAELSLSMVPILTNQNRFMTSIMDYINKSLPQGHEGQDLARGKFEQTLLNQFTTTKVLTRLGFNPDIKEEVTKLDEMGNEEASLLAKQVISLAQTYTLTAEDKKEFDAIRDDVLGSLMGKKEEAKETSYSKLWSE